MIYLNYWNYPEITASGQPVLRENEKDIYVEQNVGLYHGKSKILNKQTGRCYLTSQRLIYIDDLINSGESLYLELDDIKDLQYSSKFLKRSARIIIFLKRYSGSDYRKNRSGVNPHSSVQKSTWTCPICMVTNESSGELKDRIPPCLNCGVSPDYSMVANTVVTTVSETANIQGGQAVNTCSACTFINHPQLGNCEICGTRLATAKQAWNNNAAGYRDTRIKIQLESSSGLKEGDAPFVQISFHKSDGQIFFQALSKVLESLEDSQLKHLYNQNLVSVNGVALNSELILNENKTNQIGIASLERSKEQQILKNDILLNNALTDLNNLMALANDIENLYKNDGGNRDKELPLLIIDRDKFLNKSAFLDEISREIYQLLISEFKDQMETNGGILVTMVDLYALYNKTMRIGTGFISPQEMREACERFPKLGLTEMKLTKVNNRVLCISSGNSFEFIKKKIINIAEVTPGSDLLQIAQSLNQNNSNTWAIGIVMEVLQNCITEGDLLIDEQISGIHYYVNSKWTNGKKPTTTE
ncbi:HCL196Cp [Eremothecium sinecaudum]|uniref:Vacuolar protein-sorting-associated protein 36 n=1 Tax=Eremothecium sinecaudum TaxID=45286 RepID=A0A0X8HR87_9SACH|nr:HCL196Cp [Eremothecium sinecaudum]AMD19955.1 HCL196Cp [Eremothecium sinecaudum]